MKLKKLTITGLQAHFKIPNSSKIQRTFEIPPISTIVGILQNTYGKDINDFTLGYTIDHKGVNREITTVYKEVNHTQYSLTNAKRFTSEPTIVENLIEPRLIIYTDIDRSFQLNEPLTLGKANYLAKMKWEEVELIDEEGKGYNQCTSLDVGTGVIQRVKTLTKFNEQKGYYEYQSILVRMNKQFSFDKYYDEDEQQNIFLWKWKDGVASAKFD